MKRLYIIGNGFDVAHGLHTDYWKFRTYLEQNYPEFLIEFWHSAIGRHRALVYNKSSKKMEPSC